MGAEILLLFFFFVKNGSNCQNMGWWLGKRRMKDEEKLYTLEFNDSFYLLETKQILENCLGWHRHVM